jgi:hypothetical protein
LTLNGNFVHVLVELKLTKLSACGGENMRSGGEKVRLEVRK